MGSRKITVKLSAAERIAAIAWFIESKGMIATANKFTDAAYDYFITLAKVSNHTRFAVNHKGLLQVTNALPIKRNISSYL